MECDLLRCFVNENETDSVCHSSRAPEIRPDEVRSAQRFVQRHRRGHERLFNFHKRARVATGVQRASSARYNKAVALSYASETTRNLC